jgi:uncharacterized damage-inducible protein DinB
MDIQKELIAEFDREIATTRKILAAIPADADFAWKPHDKSMSLGQLAGHVSETSGTWAMSTLTTDKLEFPAGHKFEPYIPASTDALVEKFDKQAAEVKAALAGLAMSTWDENWQFIMAGQAFINQSKYEVWRTWVVNHMIHHRAQLGVYLRLLNKKVPGAYGPSADEM